MAKIQELYNRLLVKRKHSMGDVVIRLKYDEVDILLDSMKQTGANEAEGKELLESFKNKLEEGNKENNENEFIDAYDGLRAKVNTGKHKDAVGHITIDKNNSKPLRIIFPNGSTQRYNTLQINIIDKDKEKFNSRMEKILRREAL